MVILLLPLPSGGHNNTLELHTVCCASVVLNLGIWDAI